MAVKRRQYDPESDYALVSRFLTEIYGPGKRSGNWLEPRWEYMNYHPNLDSKYLDRFGIWMDRGDVVAFVHYEGGLGEAFFQLRHGYEYLKPEMLDYAEDNLALLQDGHRKLTATINESDADMTALLTERGYEKKEARPQWESAFEIPQPFPEIALPEGYSILSLADECDVAKVHRVMWRGFNHEGEPPEDGLEWRRRKLSAPSLRPDLTIVVQAPNADYASFCGMWYDSTHKFCMVEPVATDPIYRRKGLGRAAVLEGVRRCANLGAQVAYVGSGQPFYLSFGFRKLFADFLWTKEWM